MSLVPAFEIGLWNAWIPAVILFLSIMLSAALPRDIGKRITPPEESQKARAPTMVVFLVMILYSVFLPLKLGTAWFYAGLVVYLLGFVISGAALFAVGATEPGEPWTTGIYRYSRHPIALGTILPMVGTGIAAASWLFLLLSAILTAAYHFASVDEERVTAVKYGEAYREYMARTPRWLGLPRQGKD